MKGSYEIVQHETISDLNIFLVQLSYRSPHFHREFEICMVMDGEIQVSCNEAIFKFRKGDIFFLNPYQIHELHSIGKAAYILSIQMASGAFKRFFPEVTYIRIDCVPLFQNSQQCTQYSSRKIKEMLLDLAISYFRREKAYLFHCMSYVAELFAAILESHPNYLMDEAQKLEQTQKAQRLQRITDYIDEHYMEKLLLSDIAEMEHLSLHYLSHFFKSMLGMSFQDYLAHLRFEHARYYVENTTKSISEICLECGFSDYRYLNKIYEKNIGYSPKEYRKTHPIQGESSKEINLLDTQTFLSPEDSLVLLHNTRVTKHFSPGSGI